MRHFILSQPKAGTYLCGNLLQEFGIGFCNCHVSAGKYTYYAPEKVAQGTKKPEVIRCELKQSIEQCLENQYIVGHLGHSGEARELLKGWKKIILCRDMEEREESFKEWQETSKRNWNETIHARYTVDIPKYVMNWTKEPDVFILDFKHMININVERLDALQEYLFGEVKHDSAQCMQRALDADSLTKSKKRK